MTDPAVTKAHKAHIYRIIRQWKHWVWNEKAVNSDVELIYNIVAREKDEQFIRIITRLSKDGWAYPAIVDKAKKELEAGR